MHNWLWKSLHFLLNILFTLITQTQATYKFIPSICDLHNFCFINLNFCNHIFFLFRQGWHQIHFLQSIALKYCFWYGNITSTLLDCRCNGFQILSKIIIGTCQNIWHHRSEVIVITQILKLLIILCIRILGACSTLTH